MPDTISAARLLDVLFPPSCLICASADLAGSGPLCTACMRNIDTQMQTHYCPRCGRTVPAFALDQGCCSACSGKHPPISGSVRAGPYRDQFGYLVRQFKYNRRWELLGLLAGRMIEELRLAPWYDRLDALVVVPGWWPRQVRRGYYAPRALAKRISRFTGLPLLSALKRTGGKTQVGLSAAQRKVNPRGKFAVRSPARVDGLTLCLVDDVITTGTTTEECARVLLRAGAEQVFSACTAHGEGKHV